jgi:thioredoxin reductase (NADPH)
MSSGYVPSALDAGKQIFPVLTAAQIDRIRPGATVRDVVPGEVLFQPGDTEIPFLVILSGSMEILQSGLGGERLITTHYASSFTGELSMISGQRCMVLGRIAEAGQLLQLSGAGLRSLIGRDAELSDIVMRAFILRRLALISNNFGNVILMGSRHSASTLRLREFLGRNGYPYNYVDLDTDRTSQELLDHFSVKAEDVPVVICDLRAVLRSPSNQQLAECLGLNVSVDAAQMRDLIIVGAGPAGLAAAVYGASEGLDTLLIESDVPGGQAGSSSRIENYLGFPTGVSGQELSARAVAQAQKFGTRMMVAHRVTKLDCDHRPYRILLDDGSVLSARAFVIATGAQYNRPAIADLHKFEGQGIYYGATYIEAQLCVDDEVIVVGGGNSAGQAAIFLAQTSRKVYMLVRSGGLAESMSRYLIQRISEHPGIELLFNTEIVELEGDEHLERVAWKNQVSGQTSKHEVHHLFIMAGASPHTEWLRGCVAMDEKGFILTGRDLALPAGSEDATAWPLTRPPQMLETSLPGVFAVGDVRSGSVKRVASAVGEGAIAVSLVHRTLTEL